ncbi:hypothetical protein ACIQM4_15875 [Streptomyces sp. NPDC091272]|uniref:hypothetical protein n=1 Tax=Streptomyces sp. NPDC091272 TaxID=3365981 RepID=UPI003807EF2C
MNIRSLTRGDGVVIGAAVVLFIASFLSLNAAPDCSGIDARFCPRVSVNAWDSLGLLMSVYLAGVIAAVLIVVARGLPAQRKVAGIELGQFGVALAVFAAWTAFWTIIDAGSSGAGLILGLIAALVLAAGAVASPLVPALKAPLMGAPKPAVANHPYGAQPGAGYGYPGGQQQSYGGQPAPGGYGYPAGATQDPHAAQAAQTGAAQAAPDAGRPAQGEQAPAGADASGFAPFWFAVPVARPLYPEDGAPTPIAELAPGTWYLAVDQRGPGLVAQTQDGRRGLLQDTTGIQRG